MAWGSNRPFGQGGGNPFGGSRPNRGGGASSGLSGLGAASRPNRRRRRPERERTPNAFDVEPDEDDSEITVLNPERDVVGLNFNPLAREDARLAFNELDNRRASTWGALNQAGITRQGNSGLQAQRVENVISDWMDDFEGKTLAENPDLQWDTHLKGLLGNGMTAAPATAPSGVQIDQTGNISPGTGVQINQSGAIPAAGLSWEEFVRQQAGSGVGQLNAGRRQRLREQFNAQAAAAPAAPPTAPVGQGPTVVNPTQARSVLNAALESQTPEDRFYESSRFTGPKRTISY